MNKETLTTQLTQVARLRSIAQRKAAERTALLKAWELANAPLLLAIAENQIALAESEKILREMTVIAYNGKVHSLPLVTNKGIIPANRRAGGRKWNILSQYSNTGSGSW